MGKTSRVSRVNKVKYTITITEQTGRPDDYRHEDSHVVHVEPFAKHGSMMLWARQWYKMQGVDRKPRKAGKGRSVQLQEYGIPEVHVDFNFGFSRDWSEVYKGQWFDSYYQLLAENAHRYGEPHPTIFHPEWGVPIVTIYPYKIGKGESFTWKIMWARVEDTKQV